jgi:hypothetical protein
MLAQGSGGSGFISHKIDNFHRQTCEKNREEGLAIILLQAFAATSGLISPSPGEWRQETEGLAEIRRHHNENIAG